MTWAFKKNCLCSASKRRKQAGLDFSSDGFLESVPSPRLQRGADRSRVEQWLTGKQEEDVLRSWVAGSNLSVARVCSRWF